MKDKITKAALALGLSAPWLFPLATGPSPSAQQLILSLFAISVLFGFAWPWDKHPKLVLQVWVAASVLTACIGVIQYMGAVAPLSPWISPADAGQAYGNLRQRNQFAVLQVMGLASLAALLQLGLRQSIALAAAGLMSIGVAMSASRIGLLGLVLVCAWTISGFSRRHTRYVGFVACVGGAFVVAGFLAPWLLQLAQGVEAPTAIGRALEEPGCGSRMVLWSNVAHLIAKKPWFGWGWGELDYAHYMTLYPGLRFCDILDNAHNLPMHLAVELGVPCAALVSASICGLALWRRPWRESDPCRRAAWFVLTIILIHSLVEYPMWYGPFQLTVVFCAIWLLCAAVPKDTVGRYAVTTSGQLLTFPKVGRLGIAALLACTASYAWWDYHRISQLYTPYEQRSRAYQINTLQKVSNTFLFADQVRFAKLTMTPLTADNARQIHKLAEELIHYSPEPRVIESLIESLELLERHEEALAHIARYQAAFPQQFQKWQISNAGFSHPVDLRGRSP